MQRKNASQRIGGASPMAAETASRTNRLAANAVFGLMAWILPLMIGFFTTPVLVKGLGTESYGLFAVISGFVTYSFSFGIGKIATKYVAEYRATGEIDKISPVVSATFFFSLAITLLGAIVVVLGAPRIVSDILLLQGEPARIAVTSLYLACGIIGAAMVSQIYQFVLQGLQRFGSFLILTNLSGILFGVGNITIVLFGGGIVDLLVWNIIVALIGGLLFYIASRKFLPQLHLTVNINRTTFNAVAGYGTSIIFYQIFGNILFIFERTLVMRKFGAEALAYYSVPMMLAIYLHTFVGSFAAVLFPVVNELLTDRERQIDLYKKASKIILAVVVFAVSTFICTGRIGLAVWINDDFAANSYWLLVIHMLTFGSIGMFVIVWQLAEGFRHAKLNAMITAFWLVVAVPIMIYGSRIYGPEGIAASRLIAVWLSVPMIFYVEKQFLGQIFWRFWSAMVVRVSFGVIAAMIVETIVVRTLRPTWPMLAATGTLGLAAFVVTLYLTQYLTRSEQTLLSDLVTGKFRSMRRRAA